MSKLTKFQNIAISNANEVKGGTFTKNNCTPAPSYCAPKPSACAPQTNYCAPKPTYCAPKPTLCLPKISFSFSFGGCW